MIGTIDREIMFHLGLRATGFPRWLCQWWNGLCRAMESYRRQLEGRQHPGPRQERIDVCSRTGNEHAREQEGDLSRIQVSVRCAFAAGDIGKLSGPGPDVR